MLDQRSPEGLRVLQLTHDPAVPCAHVYMEAEIFSPDSRLFLYERNGNAHDPFPDDPRHAYMLCDIEDDCRAFPLMEELNAIGPAFSPDGAFVYYFLNNPAVPDRAIELKRVRPDGRERETLAVIGPTTNHSFWLRSLSHHPTISPDGERLATGACVIDRQSRRETYGVVVFDLASGEAQPIWTSDELGNPHLQYCRAPGSRDILVQHNHGYRWDTRNRSETSRYPESAGIDIHVLRDDGKDLRSLPWGRNGTERCQGHQCWRGTTPWAITSTQTRLEGGTEARLVEGLPTEDQEHLGANLPGGQRNELSRSFPDPQFHHFGTDRAGGRLISDYWTTDPAEHLYLFELGQPGVEAFRQGRYLLDTGTAFQRSGTESPVMRKANQSHPFLSPGGRRAFFNSNRTGTLQIYMVENLPF